MGLPLWLRQEWVSKDTSVGTRHLLKDATQYVNMEDDEKSVLGKVTLIVIAESYDDDCPSISEPEPHYTQVSATLEMVSFGETETIPGDEKRIIHAIFLPYIGHEFEHTMSVEDAKILALVCRDELARKLSIHPAESPTVREIQRLLRLYKLGPEDESADERQERVNFRKRTLGTKNAEDARERPAELVDLKSALSKRLYEHGPVATKDTGSPSSIAQ